LRYYDLASSWREESDQIIELLPNQSTELVKKSCPHRGLAKDDLVCPSATVVVQASLLDPSTGDQVATFADWPQPFRYLDFPNPGLEIVRKHEVLEVEVQSPVKCLVFSIRDTDGVEVIWSDNALDLFPGKPCEVRCRDLGDKAVWAAWMGNEHAVKVA